MTKPLISTVAALALALAAAGMGEARVTRASSSITDCGYTDYAHWSATPLMGAGYHLTTRNVACSYARRFSKNYKGTDSYYPTWRCREINQYEQFDVRCVSGSRVIRFVGGA